MKVYVIAAMHGNEKFGLKILSRLNTDAKGVKIRVGNLEAIAKDKRFIESDLNRSFRLKVPTKESRLADAIMEEIRNFKPDYIIDIHTSITDVGKVAIVAERNARTHLLAQALGVESIVIMPRKYTKHSLIGYLPDRSVSLEFGRGLRSDSLAEEIAKNISNLSHVKAVADLRLPLFRVTTTLEKGHRRIGKVSNLKFDAQLKAYPFLVNKKSYNDIGGFLAQKVN